MEREGSPGWKMRVQSREEAKQTKWWRPYAPLCDDPTSAYPLVEAFWVLA